jgi:hypothetical protein
MVCLKLRGARLLSAIFVLVCSTPAVLLANEAQISAQQGSCALHQLVALNLEVSENGRFLVPVKINSIPTYLYLEIGDSFSELFQQSAGRFKLLESEIGKGIGIMRGARPIQRFADADLTIGELSYPQERFLIDPLDETSGTNVRPEVIGILGMDLLWKTDLELDLAHHKLGLYKHSNCWNQIIGEAGHYNVVPLQRDAFGNIFFPMELDGRKLEALLTTGSPETTLSTDVTKRVYGFDKDSSGIETTTDGSGHKTAQYRAMKLTASGLTLTDEKVRLIEPPNNSCHLARKGDVIGYTGCLYRYPLRLGSDVLSRLHVYIATQNNLMYYTVNAESVSH